MVKRVALVVYSSNSSLCGGFNSNIIKMMMHAVDEYKAQGIDDITVYPIGRKVAEKAQKLGLHIAGDLQSLLKSQIPVNALLLQRNWPRNMWQVNWIE